MSKKSMLRYESKQHPVLPRRAFVRRFALHFLVATAMIGVSLFGGMAGYHYFESMAWIDAFANASMILSGMGPLDAPKTWGGKLFAGLYALYSGLIIIVAAGVILGPVLHRMLHQFHAPDDT